MAPLEYDIRKTELAVSYAGMVDIQSTAVGEEVPTFLLSGSPVFATWVRCVAQSPKVMCCYLESHWLHEWWRKLFLCWRTVYNANRKQLPEISRRIR